MQRFRAEFWLLFGLETMVASGDYSWQDLPPIRAILGRHSVYRPRMMKQGEQPLHFVQLCTQDQTPEPGSLGEYTVMGRQICLANDGGRLAAVDNICPHRKGPLAEGWIENGKVLCPWHAWAFDLESGQLDHDSKKTIAVFPLRVESGSILIGLPD